MLNTGKKRNSNELYGAYGHNLTYDEMLWLANWCFVRGQNLLIPHAFYYSVRGPRLEERPPDVGPNSKWWDDYRRYADGCRRMSWLNTGSKHICDIAVLCEESFLPCKAASILFRNQLDFNYLETDHLIMKAKTDGKGVHIAGMNYRVVIIDSISHIPDAIVPQLKSLAENGRLIVSENSGPACRFKGAVIVNDDKSMISALDRVIRPDIELSPASEDIRLRHVVKDGIDYCFLFNEDENNVTITLHHTIKGTSLVIDPFTMNTQRLNTGEPVSFKPHEIKILIIRK
jgi:hypothetical protein